MAKKYYKVVRRKRGQLVSAIAGWLAWAPSYECTYTTDTWTQGKRKLPVLAFSSLRAARDFAGTPHEIWLAEVKHPQKQDKLAIACGHASFLVAFWEGDDSQPDYFDRAVAAPFGTVACEAIKLVKKVA